MRIVRIIVIVVAIAAGLWLLPASFGGATSYVVTYGNSMEPGFHAGDLALVQRAETYETGDVVAYHSPSLDTVVMHRIIAIEHGQYSFKGDNNNFIDADTPSQDELIGKLLIRIPAGGIWLDRLTTPVGLGVAAFLLLITGTRINSPSRRKRRRQRRPFMSTARLSMSTLTSLPPAHRAVAIAVIVLAVLGVALAVPAWAGPTERRVSTESASTGEVRFSYEATVAPGPVYENATVTSPEPVFRNLVNTVDVSYVYNGQPGTLETSAELTTEGGWHASVPLSPPADADGNDEEGTVQLDLDALEARAQSAAAITGIPVGSLTVSVVVHVVTTSGHEFSPALDLVLAPLQLTLKGEPDALTVSDAATVTESTTVPRLIVLGNWSISSLGARIVSAALLLAAALAGFVLFFAMKQSAAAGERVVIRRRHGKLLVNVRPVDTSGLTLVDVSGFAELAKLAERYGQLVLHWSGEDGETYIVQESTATYRYRTTDEQSSARI